MTPARRPYEIRLHPEAQRAYARLHGSARERVATAIDGLSREPRPHGDTKLAGRDDFRIRVGDYRVVYAVDDDRRLIVIARIAHRREVYRR
ncbi:MAG: type II toxin-antitoxin system RelE/ParE family toxin [Chloroflexi bacterium]|nr:MAG: type II toxin-antitoxin system RelE/ParE family toxin [Chloroflexota bacterium]